MSCNQKLAHNRTSQGKPYNLDQATARNQGCNTAQCAPYKTDLVPTVIVASALFPNSRPRPLLPDSRSTCPPVPPSTVGISAADSAGSAPSPTPSRTSGIARHWETYSCTASRSRRNRSGGASFADTSPTSPPPPPGDFRGIAYSTRYAPCLVEMASCGRTAELLTRFLSLIAIRFAPHRGVEALPQPTSG